MMIRVIANTLEATQHWERRCDELPYLVVPMSDGRRIRYNPGIQHPGFQRAMDGVKRIGYEMKKAGGCGNSQPAAYENDQNNSITEGGKSE